MQEVNRGELEREKWTLKERKKLKEVNEKDIPLINEEP